MSSIPPKKDWMIAPKISMEYLQGVESFLTYVRANLGGLDWFSCPCTQCQNVHGKMTLIEISEHLICNGIDPSYTTWYHHGKPHPRTYTINSAIPTESCNDQNHVIHPRMMELVNDALGRVQSVGLDINGVGFDVLDDEVQAGHPYENNFQHLRIDSTQPLYPSCKLEHTKLATIIELMSLKTRN